MGILFVRKTECKLANDQKLWQICLEEQGSSHIHDVLMLPLNSGVLLKSFNTGFLMNDAFLGKEIIHLKFKTIISSDFLYQNTMLCVYHIYGML